MGKKSRFKYGPKYKSATNLCLRRNAIETSTPQKYVRRPDARNQNFDEIEPIAEGIQYDSICDDEKSIKNEMIIEQAINVAARKRHSPSKIAQTRTSIQENGRGTTRSSGIVQGNTVTGADEIHIDDNQVESPEILTRSRNGTSIVRRRIISNYFNSTESDASSCCTSIHENLRLPVNVQIHNAYDTTSSEFASSSVAEVSDSTKNATESAYESSLLIEHSQRTEVHEQTSGAAGDNSHEAEQISCSNASSDTSSHLNKITSSNRFSAQFNNNISILSASFDLTPLVNNDLPAAAASISKNRLTKTKTKVGFNTSCAMHNKSIDVKDTSHEKIVMKGGKWRRTIVGMRKNKSSQRKFFVC